MANQGITGLRRFADGGSAAGAYRGPGMPDPAFGPGTGWQAGTGTVAAGIGNAGIYTGDKPITRGPSGDYYDPLFPPSPNIQPLQKGETMQDYYTRLGQWEQTPEGRAVKAKQEADRWDAVNKIRAGMTQTQTGGTTAGPTTTGPTGGGTTTSGKTTPLVQGSTEWWNAIGNTNLNPNIGVTGVDTSTFQPNQPTLGQWQNAWTGQWKTPADVASLFRQTPGANPNPSASDLQYYLQKGPEQLLKDVQTVRTANPTMANLMDQQRAQQGLRFQGVYQPQYQNYANPLTMTNVSSYGTRPAPSAAYQNYASGNPMTPGGIPAMMQNIQKWASGYADQGGAGIGQIAADMQKYGINAADLQAAYSGGYGANAPSLFNPSLYASNPAMDAVKAQYAGIGRFGVGTGMGQIDPSGLQYWTNQLQSGALPQQQFPGAFQNAVQNYYNQYPTSGVTQMGQMYQNTYGPGFGRVGFGGIAGLGGPQYSAPAVMPEVGMGTGQIMEQAAPRPTTRPYYESYNQPQTFPIQGAMGGMGGFGGYKLMGGGFGGMGGVFGAPQKMAAPIVSRSAQAMGTPNVMMRRAEGGITSLFKK